MGADSATSPRSRPAVTALRLGQVLSNAVRGHSRQADQINAALEAMRGFAPSSPSRWPSTRGAF